MTCGDVNLTEWISRHQQELELLGVTSLITFVFTLIALPIAVINLPEDYFTRQRRKAARRVVGRPLLWGAVTALKNLLGLLFILAGLAMLVLPGQGVVTILIGLALTNFPGKYSLERRMFRRPAVHENLNWIRKRSRRPPLRIPESAEPTKTSGG